VSDVCIEDWKCSEWSTCTYGIQARSCKDFNLCGTNNSEPQIIRICEEGSTIEKIPGEQNSEVGTPKPQQIDSTQQADPITLAIVILLTVAFVAFIFTNKKAVKRKGYKGGKKK